MKFIRKTSLLFWLPRILSSVFVVFLSLFALDVFNEYSGPAAVTPFLINLIPALILLLVVIVSWRHELVGVLAFLAFSFIYVSNVGLDKHWSWYVAIPLPSAIVSILFLLSWIKKKRRAKL